MTKHVTKNNELSNTDDSNKESSTSSSKEEVSSKDDVDEKEFIKNEDSSKEIIDGESKVLADNMEFQTDLETKNNNSEVSSEGSSDSSDEENDFDESLEDDFEEDVDVSSLDDSNQLLQVQPAKPKKSKQKQYFLIEYDKSLDIDSVDYQNKKNDIINNPDDSDCLSIFELEDSNENKLFANEISIRELNSLKRGNDIDVFKLDQDAVDNLQYGKLLSSTNLFFTQTYCTR